MMVPNAAQATVDARKITQYLLNSSHPDNGGKAKFFFAYGFRLDDAVEFERALLNHPILNKAMRTITGPAGTKYVVECNIRSPDGRNPCIRTVWMDDGTAPLRLITAYPF